MADSEQTVFVPASTTSTSSTAIASTQANVSMLHNVSSSSSSSLSATTHEAALKRLRPSLDTEERKTNDDIKTDDTKPRKPFTDSLNDVCPICLEEVDAATQPTSRLLCKHIFHLTCLGPWLAKSERCPMCRGDIIPKTNQVAQNQFSSSSTHAPAAPPQAVANVERDAEGYRIYRDGTADMIHHADENVRLINYNAYGVQIGKGELVIEGTSHVNLAETEEGHMIIQGSAHVDVAITGNAGMMILQSARVELAQSRTGTILINGHARVDETRTNSGAILDWREHS